MFVLDLLLTGAMDWSLTDFAGPHVRLQVHPHHRLSLGAPAHHLDLLLLRPARASAPRTRRYVLFYILLY